MRVRGGRGRGAPSRRASGCPTRGKARGPIASSAGASRSFSSASADSPPRAARWPRRRCARRNAPRAGAGRGRRRTSSGTSGAAGGRCARCRSRGRDVLSAVAHRPGDDVDRLVALGRLHLADLDAPDVELGAGFPLCAPVSREDWSAIDCDPCFHLRINRAVAIAARRGRASSLSSSPRADRQRARPPDEGRAARRRDRRPLRRRRVRPGGGDRVGRLQHDRPARRDDDPRLPDPADRRLRLHRDPRRADLARRAAPRRAQPRR